MIDARQFNIRDSEGHLLCPACGFPSFADEDAYDERGGLVGITICPCCLWEPGFDDGHYASAAARETILESLRAYRAGWNGRPEWRGRAAERPPTWDGERQLSHLLEVAPYVR